jgi:hypothetical protein
MWSLAGHLAASRIDQSRSTGLVADTQLRIVKVVVRVPLVADRVEVHRVADRIRGS